MGDNVQEWASELRKPSALAEPAAAVVAVVVAVVAAADGTEMVFATGDVVTGAAVGVAVAGKQVGVTGVAASVDAAAAVANSLAETAAASIGAAARLRRRLARSSIELSPVDWCSASTAHRLSRAEPRVAAGHSADGR